MKIKQIKRCFALALVMALCAVALLTGCGGEKIIWEDMVLGEHLPEPPEYSGKIYSNSIESLNVYIESVSAKQYADYINSCKEKGFTVDAEMSSYSYNAYNTEGYKLSLDHYGDDADMQIELTPPMELSEILWPESGAAKQIPKPESSLGKIKADRDDYLSAYIGNTTQDDFNAYANACKEAGFNIDYDKGDDYYHANNSKGWRLTIEYEGFNIICIEATAPKEETSSKVPTTTSSEDSKPVSSEDKPEKDTDIDSIRADFKTAMDSYEDFIDDYVAFMKKYAANPTDISLISDYADYMSDYTDMVADFEKWESDDLNSAELKYYIDVQARVSKKLLEVAG